MKLHVSNRRKRSRNGHFPLFAHHARRSRPMTARVLSADYETSLIRASSLVTGQVVKEVGLPSPPSAIAISHNGDYLAVAQAEGTLILSPITLIKLALVHTGPTLAVAFSVDGLLATGGEDGSVQLHRDDDNLQTFDFMSSETSHTDHVHCVLFSSSSPTLVSGSRDHTAIVWSFRQGLEALYTLTGHTRNVMAAIFLDDNTIATCSTDETIRIWSVNTGECVRELRNHHDDVNTLCLSPDGALFASGSKDRKVKVFSTASYECLKTIKCTDNVTALFFLDSSDDLLAGIEGSRMVAINITNQKVTKKLASHIHPSAVIAFGMSSSCRGCGILICCYRGARF